MSQLCIIDIDPKPKPRMVHSDRFGWRQTPAARKYFQWKTEFQALLKQKNITAIDHDGFLQVEFHLPMAKSWSKKKKLKMFGEPHRQRPDLDNLIKALLDSIYAEDCNIYSIKAKKIWADTGKIVIKMPETIAGAQSLAGTHLNPAINIDEHYSLPFISGKTLAKFPLQTPKTHTVPSKFPEPENK